MFIKGWVVLNTLLVDSSHQEQYLCLNKLLRFIHHREEATDLRSLVSHIYLGMVYIYLALDLSVDACDEPTFPSSCQCQKLDNFIIICRQSRFYLSVVKPTCKP